VVPPLKLPQKVEGRSSQISRRDQQSAAADMTFSERSQFGVPPQQSATKNQNLAHIIESFKKEKSAFNERFSELKKRLDTFNNKRTGNYP
jgi:uncharacterized coiled-coil DUF342 family protein